MFVNNAYRSIVRFLVCWSKRLKQAFCIYLQKLLYLSFTLCTILNRNQVERFDFFLSPLNTIFLLFAACANKISDNIPKRQYVESLKTISWDLFLKRGDEAHWWSTQSCLKLLVFRFFDPLFSHTIDVRVHFDHSFFQGSLLVEVTNIPTKSMQDNPNHCAIQRKSDNVFHC